MSGTILQFPGAAKNVATLLAEAGTHDLELAVVLGFTSDGHLYLGGTRCDIRDLTVLAHYFNDAISDAISAANEA